MLVRKHSQPLLHLVSRQPNNGDLPTAVVAKRLATSHRQHRDRDFNRADLLLGQITKDRITGVTLMLPLRSMNKRIEKVLAGSNIDGISVKERRWEAAERDSYACRRII